MVVASTNSVSSEKLGKIVAPDVEFVAPELADISRVRHFPFSKEDPLLGMHRDELRLTVRLFFPRKSEFSFFRQRTQPGLFQKVLVGNGLLNDHTDFRVAATTGGADRAG